MEEMMLIASDARCVVKRRGFQSHLSSKFWRLRPSRPCCPITCFAIVATVLEVDRCKGQDAHHGGVRLSLTFSVNHWMGANVLPASRRR